MDVLLYDYIYIYIYIFYSERYLGPKPLLRKRYYSELIETIRHNYVNMKKKTISKAETLIKKKILFLSLLKLVGTVMST